MFAETATETEPASDSALREQAHGLAQALLAFSPQADALPTRMNLQRLAIPQDLLDALPDNATRERVIRLYVRRWRGSDPPAEALATAPGRWVLLPVAALELRLCALALARRPGVLRSCVARQPRNELAALLGPVLVPLKELSLQAASRPIDSAFANAGAGFWVQVGYLDAVAAGAWRHPSLQRMVRATLPPLRWPRGPWHSLKKARPFAEALVTVVALVEGEASC